MNNVTERSLDLINQGCALMAKEQYSIALERFIEAVADSPKYVECYINLGNVYACLEEYDKALDNFRKALLLEPESSEILFDIGNIYNLQGKIANALDYYNRADEKGNMTSEMYDIMAEMFSANGDDVQALRYINKAIEINPLKGEYYLEKASIFISQEKIMEAESTLLAFHKKLPDAYEAYDLLSEIYIKKGDFDYAIALVDEGINRFPKDGNLLHLKLKVLAAFDKDEEVCRFIGSNKNTDAYRERLADNTVLEAEIYLKHNNTGDAIKCLEYVADEKYSECQVAFLLATIYYKLGEFEKTLYITDCMMNQDLTLFFSASAQFYHAQANEALGKIEEAEKEYRTITKSFRRMTIMEPSFYEGYMYRLLAHKSLKEYDEALSLADYMLNLFPERPDGHIFKYVIYRDTNQTDLAETERREVLALDPGFQF